ncbi:MAG: chloramphenicol acetyltransferase [Clostridia bacterium]|nr:chloramphenicol acetyltransferase [Clostridia bacterium]
MNEYRIINQKTWKRATHCAVFRNYAEPMFCVTFELDVTNFLQAVKKKGLSFTMSVIYAATVCANNIEEFRYRFVGGDVVLFDKIDTAFTYLDEETRLFKVVNVPICDSLEEYVSLAKKTAKEQKEYFTRPLVNNVFQFSAMPWVPYTHISHTISGKKDSATPLFNFGKYTQKDGRVVMPFSAQVHHSFVDGAHIGELYESLQEFMNNIE